MMGASRAFRSDIFSVSWWTRVNKIVFNFIETNNNFMYFIKNHFPRKRLEEDLWNASNWSYFELRDMEWRGVIWLDLSPKMMQFFDPKNLFGLKMTKIGMM